MKAFKYIAPIRTDEDGAVTLDWVVLTAAVVGLGVAALAVVKIGAGTTSSKIGTHIESQSVSTTF